MLPSPNTPVNPSCPVDKPPRQKSWKDAWLWGSCEPTWGKDLRTFSILFGLPALLIWLMGLDTPIAHALYQPDIDQHAFKVATFLRHYGTLPGAVLTFVAIVGLLWPRVWRHHPVLYRLAMVITFTAVIGVGLMNQVVVKKLTDRTRPHESVLIDTPLVNDGFRGNSMPSGHAAMGFLLAAPFFPLRRSHPRTAAMSLATGLVVGSVVGLSRMALGAHFATDVLIAGFITFSAASIFTYTTLHIKRISHLSIAIATLACTLLIIVGNRFSHFTLTLPLNQPVSHFSLPCTPQSSPVPGVTVTTLTVQLNGYGAPLSNLKMFQNQGDISIQRQYGLYHHLTCTATIALPIQ